ncbi:hypothetical protein GP486_008823 [Trichoglossum hirsutum]|uniref:Uncharacterized protein n=1 Tax=Trichoglossum hirsutum TaxID=265104 RepID=A0A9P8I6T6_9PEZI|nr:hypothetical protein GP486_008823 [Trichoglossum hirsutum]
MKYVLVSGGVISGIGKGVIDSRDSSFLHGSAAQDGRVEDRSPDPTRRSVLQNVEKMLTDSLLRVIDKD